MQEELIRHRNDPRRNGKGWRRGAPGGDSREEPEGAAPAPGPGVLQASDLRQIRARPGPWSLSSSGVRGCQPAQAPLQLGVEDRRDV